MTQYQDSVIITDFMIQQIRSYRVRLPYGNRLGKKEQKGLESVC